MNGGESELLFNQWERAQLVEGIGHRWIFEDVKVLDCEKYTIKTDKYTLMISYLLHPETVKDLRENEDCVITLWDNDEIIYSNSSKFESVIAAFKDMLNSEQGAQASVAK